jgi:hypothetical protein
VIVTENGVISIMQWGIIDDFNYYYDDRVIYGYALRGILRLAGRRVYVALFIMVISDNKNSTVYLFVAVCVAYCNEQVLFIY